MGIKGHGPLNKKNRGGGGGAIVYQRYLMLRPTKLGAQQLAAVAHVCSREILQRGCEEVQQPLAGGGWGWTGGTGRAGHGVAAGGKTGGAGLTR